jgi:hypothetical protein
MQIRGASVSLMLLAYACDRGGTTGGPDEPATPDAAVTIDAGSTPGTPDGGTRAPDAVTATDAVPVPGTPDGGTIPPDDDCASSPTGDWAGSTKYFGRGSGPHQSNGGDLVWTLVSSEDCVDRYAPSGTAWVDNQGYECESNYVSSAPIAATDGVLTVDRTTSPATYTMTGATHWQVTTGCPDAEPMTAVSNWASYRGVIDGDVFGGGHRQDGWNIYWQWRFTRVGAELPPPDGCSEPAEDTWTGMHTAGRGDGALVAMATWTRVSTDGCIDRFQPSGSATFVFEPDPGCTAKWVEPATDEIAPDDGFLEIDRSTNPPTFVTQAGVSWSATIHCMHEDGTTTSYPDTVGERWDDYGPLDGDLVAGTLVRELTEHAWRLER